jgi:hypothetical protein
MAAQKGDVTIVRGGVGDVIVYAVDDRTTSSQTETIKPGNPVVQDAENFVEIAPDGDPINTDGAFVGIAANESTETADADGVVNVALVIPNLTILRAKATTPANIDTAAKLLAIISDAITFDNTSNVITIDENEGDDPNVHGLVVIGGDINKGTLDFVVKPLATIFGNNI